MQMEEIDRIYRLLLTDTLEAKLVLCEIARAGFNAQIDSPDATPEGRAESIASRDAALIEWGNTLTELEDLRRPENSN